MKTLIRVMIILCSVFLLSTGSFAQAKKKINKKFMTSWKKTSQLTAKKRSFKTEKAVTVAAVRGAEAEDAALKHLYWRGGSNYPSRQELLNAIKILEEAIREEPEDESVPESRFFIGQCYVELGNNVKAKENYNEIIKSFPKSDFAAQAKKELEALKQNK